MRTRKVHLSVALLSGLIVFAVLYVAAWYNLRGARNVCHRQDYTRITLRFIDEKLTEFQKKQGEFPARLTDIPNMPVPQGVPGTLFTDAWGNPIQYSVSDNSFTLFSFGRDGKKSGIGLDAELYHDDRNHEETLVTFEQFFFARDFEEVSTGSFVVAGILAGLFVTFTVFRSLREVESEEQVLSRAQLLGSVLVVIVLACAIGIYLLPFYIPSGH